MNSEIIRSKYPKSYEKLAVWTKNIVGQYGGYDKTTLDSLPIDDIIKVTLTYSTRNLYDFFDGLNIIMECGYDVYSKEFGPRVNSDTRVYSYSSRKEAEETGFMTAFDRLEKEL